MAKLDRFLAAVEHTLLGSALLGASAVLFINVVLRYFGKGIVWAEESVRYLIIWMVFIGGSVAARQASHINVDVLLQVLPAGIRRRVWSVINAAAALFCAALAVWGWQLMLLIRQSGQITPALQMPTYIAYLAIPVGSALMTLRFAQAAVKEWGGERA